MKTTTVPASRFGWEGQTLEYVVTADGGSEISAPAESADGMQVRVMDVRETESGVEARVAVEVTGPVFY